MKWQMYPPHKLETIHGKKGMLSDATIVTTRMIYIFLDPYKIYKPSLAIVTVKGCCIPTYTYALPVPVN